ncbi:MAG: type II toxin-antitoxin system HicB family antitoxin [Coriobacteriia bacterium]|nr:type II toxin-antitoxin system HicB family antitoxin [Coriobacteriia bacterium]
MGGERVREYMAVEYPVEVTKDEFGYFVRVPDLPGCESNGDSLEEAFRAIEEARELWITAALESKRAIPLPRGEDDYSGKFVVRVGSAIHRDLVRIAAHEGVSLNSLVLGLLARETGHHSTESEGGYRPLQAHPGHRRRHKPVAL